MERPGVNLCGYAHLGLKGRRGYLHQYCSQGGLLRDTVMGPDDYSLVEGYAFSFPSAPTRVYFGMCMAHVYIASFALAGSSSCHTCPFRVSFAFSIDLELPGVPGRHSWSNDLGVRTVGLNFQGVLSAHICIGAMDTP